MKSIIKFTALLAGGLAMATLTGCLSTKITDTPVVTKHADGSLTTNVVRTITERGQDPLKDKINRMETYQKGLVVKVLSGPPGTSGVLSPLEFILGEEETIITTLPVYVNATNGYTPPFAIAASRASSFSNDARVDNFSTAPGLMATNGYYPASVGNINPLVPTSGTVSSPPVPAVPATNSVAASTNAAPAAASAAAK